MATAIPKATPVDCLAVALAVISLEKIHGHVELKGRKQNFIDSKKKLVSFIHPKILDVFFSTFCTKN